MAKKKTEKMVVTMKNIGEISPYEKNPRRNLNAIAPLVKSIKEFGFRQPIVVDPEGIIIAGHTRYLAALEIGLMEVPVHVADLTPEQAKAYRIADNQIASISEWDYDLLASELQMLTDLGIDMDLLGFLDDDMTGILDEFVGISEPSTIKESHFTDEDIEEAGSHLNENLKASGEFITYTCPHCLKEFSVKDFGQMRSGREE